MTHSTNGREDIAVEDCEFCVKSGDTIESALKRVHLSGRTLQRHYKTLGRPTYPGLSAVARGGA